MPAPTQDPILKKYAQLIQAGNPGLKMIYYGDPIRIPVSSLPAIILQKVDTTVANLSNAEDEHRIRISVTAVTDVRDTISDDKQMVAGANALYTLMEGRDATTYALTATSLLGIIRHNVEVDPAHNLRTDLDSMTRCQYGLTIGKRGENSWATEGMIEFTSHFTQVR